MEGTERKEHSSYNDLCFRYEGITFDVDLARGECTMNIDRVTSYHIGKWKCQILTDRRDGRLGSQAYSSSVSVRDAARFRTKRLNDEDTLQGLRDGDTNAVVKMRAPVRADEKSVDFFWVVRRQFKVEEGDEADVSTRIKADVRYNH